MAFKIKSASKPRRPPADRAEIFQRVLKAGVYYLLIYGGFLTVLNLALAVWTHARYGTDVILYIKSLGMTLLVLGWYLLHILHEPEKQKLLSDTLLLYFLGSIIAGLISWRFSSVTPMERLLFLANLAFSILILKYRPEGFKVVLASLAWVPGLKKIAGQEDKPVPGPGETAP